jgi:hypothetical protein
MLDNIPYALTVHNNALLDKALMPSSQTGITIDPSHCSDNPSILDIQYKFANVTMLYEYFASRSNPLTEFDQYMPTHAYANQISISPSCINVQHFSLPNIVNPM